MGGDQPPTPAPPPPPPSPSATAAESITAQIETLPEQLAAQEEFGPQFAALELEQLEEFGPQFAQLAIDIQSEFGPQLLEAFAPEVAAAQTTLTDFLEGDDEDEFQRLLPGLTEDVRAAQSIRGLGDISPLGAIEESAEIARLRTSLEDRRLNVALATAGRLPISSAITPTAGTGTQNLLTQNVTPGDIFGAQSSINAFNANVFGTQGGIFGSQLANPPTSPFGSILGSAAGSALTFGLS